MRVTVLELLTILFIRRVEKSKGAKKGVFSSTSSFSKKAIDLACVNERRASKMALPTLVKEIWQGDLPASPNNGRRLPVPSSKFFHTSYILFSPIL